MHASKPSATDRTRWRRTLSTLLIHAALLSTPSCERAPEPPSPEPVHTEPAQTDPTPTESEDGWPEVIAATLDEVYGHSGTGVANPQPDATPEYVHWVPADGHVVYVTSGAYRSRFPHEFVLRVRFDDPPRDERLWRVAPEWPSRVLAAIARVEATSPRPFVPGNYLRNVTLEGLPYRHFAFLRDPVLSERRRAGEEQPLVFVQVVPLTDAQLAAIDAIPTGETNTVLRDWAARDRLLLVDPTPR